MIERHAVNRDLLFMMCAQNESKKQKNNLANSNDWESCWNRELLAQNESKEQNYENPNIEFLITEENSKLMPPQQNPRPRGQITDFEPRIYKSINNQLSIKQYKRIHENNYLLLGTPFRISL